MLKKNVVRILICIGAIVVILLMVHLIGSGLHMIQHHFGF